MGRCAGWIRLRCGPNLAAVQGICWTIPLDSVGGFQPALSRGKSRRWRTDRHFMGLAPARGRPQGKPQDQEVSIRSMGAGQGVRRGVQCRLASPRGQHSQSAWPCCHRSDAGFQLDRCQICAIFLCLILVRTPRRACGWSGHLRPLRRAHHRKGQSRSGWISSRQDIH